MNQWEKIHPDSLLTVRDQLRLYEEEMGRKILERQLKQAKERTRSVSRQRRSNLKTKKEGVLSS